MTLTELLVASAISIAILAISNQSIVHLKQILQRQQAYVFLHAEAWQAIHALEQAIRGAHNPKKELGLSALKINHSCQLEAHKAGNIVIRKGAPSMNGSDCIYTYNDRAAVNKKYQGFFIQAPTAHSEKQGSLQRQTLNRLHKLNNQALIGHMQEMQLKAGVIKNETELVWLDPHEINEHSDRKSQDVAALKIQLWLKKDRHTLYVEKIIARRNRETSKR
jgi:type II secretory pathway component PulJ